MQTYKYAAVFVAGFIASILLIGYVAEMRQEVTAKECKHLGKFLYKDTVYACVPQPQAESKPQPNGEA